MGMGGISIWQLIILGGMFLVFVLPPLAALFSSKTSGARKFVWFLLSLLLSWIGYLIYYHATVKGEYLAKQATLGNMKEL